MPSQERLDEALRRAAELLALDAKRQMGPIQTKEARNLAGWAEAVETMDHVHDWLHIKPHQPACGSWR